MVPQRSNRACERAGALSDAELAARLGALRAERAEDDPDLRDLRLELAWRQDPPLQPESKRARLKAGERLGDSLRHHLGTESCPDSGLL